MWLITKLEKFRVLSVAINGFKKIEILSDLQSVGVK